VANPHFGNLADVWKHAVLVEVLQREPPGWYAETHAGSGAYAVVRDAEREFGILRFLQVAPRFAVLARSRYRAVAARYVESHGLYPGSALLAMSVLGDDGSYLLCDLDRESVSDLRRWSRELGVHDCEIAEADGMTAVAARLDGGSRGPGLVHIDPFDPDAPGPGGYSALQLAARVADSGTGLVYWYGGAQSRDREQLAAMTGVPLWCGEVTVTGTGGCRAPAPSAFGIILANLGEDTASACEALGDAFCAAYAGAVIPDGTQANLSFASSSS
jgi:23S rRNA (adenine2030-N6)-methyltransferase